MDFCHKITDNPVLLNFVDPCYCELCILLHVLVNFNANVTNRKMDKNAKSLQNLVLAAPSVENVPSLVLLQICLTLISGKYLRPGLHLLPQWNCLIISPVRIYLHYLMLNPSTPT